MYLTLQSSRRALLLALFTFIFSAGCGESGPPRGPITGSVTVGGAPMKAGRILFLPQAPTEGPAASARIVDGKYELLNDEGPIVGNNRVEVEADLPLSFAIDDEEAFAKAKGRLPKQPVPPKFNRQSTLSVEVKSGEDNQFNVAIPAAPPLTHRVVLTKRDVMVDAPDDAASKEINAERKAAAPRTVRLEELLHGGRELFIRHGEEVYHLRVTKNGRLLLTK